MNTERRKRKEIESRKDARLTRLECEMNRRGGGTFFVARFFIFLRLTWWGMVWGGEGVSPKPPRGMEQKILYFFQKQLLYFYLEKPLFYNNGLLCRLQYVVFNYFPIISLDFLALLMGSLALWSNVDRAWW